MVCLSSSKLACKYPSLPLQVIQMYCGISEINLVEITYFDATARF
jgi:hypothetical protein